MKSPVKKKLNREKLMIFYDKIYNKITITIIKYLELFTKQHYFC